MFIPVTAQDKFTLSGYITDDKDEMIEFVIKILSDKVLNKKLSENCKQFVKDTYTIESTYGKLSAFLQSIN